MYFASRVSFFFDFAKAEFFHRCPVVCVCCVLFFVRGTDEF